MKPTLLVLAAGMGSRYGGLKQIAPVGGNGETIIEFSIFDALRSGFGPVVIVLRKEIERDFRDRAGRSIESQADIRYAFQRIDDVPGGCVPPMRRKLWGTAHAVYVARESVSTPFAVINGDDFYGRASFGELARFLRSAQPDVSDYAMVAFRLENTLSAFGPVSRGLCTPGAGGMLHHIVEYTRIERSGGIISTRNGTGPDEPLPPEAPVSMNMWGFTPVFFHQLEEQWMRFIHAHADDADAEWYLPDAVNDLVNSGNARVAMLRSSSAWYGITYREDAARVHAAIGEQIARGEYPVNLWGKHV